jgi:ABC-type histidine transport system ATPase subunit
MEPVISVRQLHKSFGAHKVLTDISVDIHSQGVVVEQGEPEQLFGNPSHERTREFLSKAL